MAELLPNLYHDTAIDLEVVQHAIQHNNVQTIDVIIRLLLSQSQRELNESQIILEDVVRRYLGINCGPRRVNTECYYLLHISSIHPVLLDILWIIRNNNLETIVDYDNALNSSPIKLFLKNI